MQCPKLALKCHLGQWVPGMGKQHNGQPPPASHHPEGASPTALPTLDSCVNFPTFVQVYVAAAALASDANQDSHVHYQ